MLIAWAFLAFADDFLFGTIEPEILPNTPAWDKARLGKRLFFDSRLGQGEAQGKSCSSCHDLLLNSSGTGLGHLRIPSIFNISKNYVFYYDASVGDLREQIQRSLFSPIELASSKERISEVLEKDIFYEKEFMRVYKKGPSLELAIDALEQFERALTTLNSPFDNFLKQKGNLEPSARHGLELFKSYGCISCHNGKNLGANTSVTLKNTFYDNCTNTDAARRAGLVPDSEGFFNTKVPALRNSTKVTHRRYAGEERDLRFFIRLQSLCTTGLNMEDDMVDDIYSFLKSLEGDIPEILHEN